MAGLIDTCGVISSPPRKKPTREEHYGALLHAVVNQQLSVKAGAAIYGRLTERFGGRTPTPEQLLADDPEELRARRRPVALEGGLHALPGRAHPLR